MDDNELATLVQLRAGLLNHENGQLVADGRKGLLIVAQGEDTLVHVLWHPREGAVASGPAEHDMVVFPTECELKQIPGQARCYVLDLKESPERNLFFWMQNPKATDDTMLVDAFNKAVNGEDVEEGPSLHHHHPHDQHQGQPQQPETRGVQGGHGAKGDDMSTLLHQFFSQNPPSTTNVDGEVNPTLLAASLLSQLAGKQGLQLQPQIDQGPSLPDVLKPELLVPLVSRLGMLEKLAPYLPEEHRTPAQLVDTVRSAQFQQQLTAFSQALQSGQLDLGQFGIHAKGYSVADFLSAIQEAVDKEKAQQEQQGHSSKSGL